MLHNIQDMPVSRKQLEFALDIEKMRNPKISIDYSLMKKFKNNNTWFIEILTNNYLKQQLL